MNGVILQPAYIPWRGFFHLIQKADVFVFYDDVQYDRRGWRNRNRVKTANGSTWITVPVSSAKPREDTTIVDVSIDWSSDWARKHWSTIELAYKKAPFFAQYAPSPFAASRPPRLRSVDLTVVETTMKCGSRQELGIAHTQFVRASTLGATGAKTDRPGLKSSAAAGATH